MAAQSNDGNFLIAAMLAIGIFFGFPSLASAGGIYICNSPAVLISTTQCSDNTIPVFVADPICTPPQVLQNHVCVTPPPICTPPQVLQNNVCVTPPPICTPPQVLENNVCVTPPPICAPPQVLQNNVCVTPPPICTPPQVLQNNVCVTPPPICTPPQVLENNVCVTPCTPPQIRENNICVTPCTPPQVRENNICVTPCVLPQVMENNVCVTPPPICTPPQVLQNNVCVTPPPICTPPQVLQNNVCVTLSPICTPPQVLQNNVCVTPPPICTPPQVLQNNVCVALSPICAPPQVLENNVCVTPPPICTPPQVLENNVCVTPPPICTPPQVLENNVCVTPALSQEKVTQPTALIASGSFAEPNDAPAEATPILVNDQPLFQVFSSPADEDWFEIYAKAGQRYTIDIPAASIGKRINPALELYDAVGNLLVSQVNSDSSGQDKQIRWTAPATGLFRIRVSNLPSVVKKSPATEVFKGEAGDYTYQIHVFLTDAPQQVLTKGRVLDNCGQGINEATVSAWLNNALTDSTLTNKSGEFGLLLNPGHYDLRILAANFQQAGQPVQVGQEATTLAEIKLLPAVTAACAANPVAQTQQVPVVYDDQQGILTIKDIVIGDKVYYVTLKNIGDYRFQLSQVLDIPGVIHADPPEYFPNVLIAKLPKVLAFDKAWKVRLKHDGNGILTIESAEPY